MTNAGKGEDLLWNRPSVEVANALFRESGDAVVVVDPADLRIIDVNSVVTRFTDLARDTLLGSHLPELVQSENRDSDGFETIRQTQTFHSRDGYRLRTQRPDLWIPVSVTISRLHFLNASPLGLVTLRDLRELNESRRIAERSSNELKRVLQSINDCVWNAIVDDRGLFQYAYLSPVIEQLTGRHVSEFLERPTAYGELVHADDQPAYEALRLKLHSGRSDHAEYRLLRDDGQTCWVNERVKCTTLQDGHVIQMFGLISDVSERVLTEKRLRQKDAELAHVARVSAMGGMASAIAHEINQPLQAITAFADIAANTLGAGEGSLAGLQELNAQISEQALRAGEIIRRLRSFVRKTDGQRAIEDLHAVVRESIEFMVPGARDAGIALRLNLSASPMHIQADRIQVQQVIVNLVRNSIEAIVDQDTSDGTVSVSTRVVEQEAQISVEDTGAGVSGTSMERLFDAFVTTKNAGLGMGTAICRTIVESHGGRIWATPGTECGTVVHFTLPLHDRG